MQKTAATIPTPAALVDRERLVQNTRHMGQRAHALGVRLRPHVKTHKCVEAARYQTEGHFGGITVSTLAEAEQFAAAGFDDITYAVPLAPGRAERAVSLSQRIDAFQVLVDHQDAVDALIRAVPNGLVVKVLVKVDCGYHRAGLLPDDPELLSLVRRIDASPELVFEGVLAHGGHAYDCVGADAIRVVAEAERAETVRAAEILRAEGITVRVVSVGSTPTAALVEDLSGVTEIRPGNYALFDLFQASIGSCSTTDVALSVVTEVIGVYADRSMFLVDAGALAMSKDRGAVHAGGIQGFGLMCDLAGHPVAGLSLTGLSQEHGKVVVDAHFEGPLPDIGTRFRVLPNHSCLVTALHEKLYVADGGVISEAWSPVRGW